MIWVTYKTTSAVLYWFPSNFRSVLRPKTAALEMFTLERIERERNWGREE